MWKKECMDIYDQPVFPSFRSRKNRLNCLLSFSFIQGIMPHLRLSEGCIMASSWIQEEATRNFVEPTRMQQVAIFPYLYIFNDIFQCMHRRNDEEILFYLFPVPRKDQGIRGSGSGTRCACNWTTKVEIDQKSGEINEILHGDVSSQGDQPIMV